MPSFICQLVQSILDKLSIQHMAVSNYIVKPGSPTISVITDFILRCVSQHLFRNIFYGHWISLTPLYISLMEHDVTISFETSLQLEKEIGLYAYVLYDPKASISPFLSSKKNSVAEVPNPTLPLKKLLLKFWITDSLSTLPQQDLRYAYDNYLIVS